MAVADLIGSAINLGGRAAGVEPGGGVPFDLREGTAVVGADIRRGGLSGRASPPPPGPGRARTREAPRSVRAG